MPHSNGQPNCLNCPQAKPTETKVAHTFSLFPSQVRFIKRILNRVDADEIAQSVRLVRDLAVYHSEVPLGQEEKAALLHVKEVIEGLEGM